MSRKQMLIAAVVVSLALPCMVRAGEVSIQTAADPFEAQDGEAGTNTSSTARITVVITAKGKALDSQGHTTGTGASEIELPAGWSLTVYGIPLAGCEFVPVKFINEGAGVYTIEVLPPPDTPVCVWRSGQYTYVVRYARGSLRGSGLGRLTIP